MRARIEGKIDAGIGERADDERDEEPRAAARRGEIDGIGQTRSRAPTTMPRA